MFANTLDVASGATTVNLGTPGNSERIGFFLIQDGFDCYGNLPDNLSFVTPGTLARPISTPACRSSSCSATLGRVDRRRRSSIPFRTLNPGDAIQVLSGVAPGGRELLIGFEDLPTGTGDNDFQDVVIGVRTNHDGIFFV